MSTPERGLGAGAAAACGQDDPIDDTETSNVIAESTTSPGLTMSLAPVLPELVPRSPSSQILGTPFTTESRFEYPFPDTSSSDASSMVLSSSFPSLSASSSTSFPASSSSHSLILSTSPPSITTHFPQTFPLPAYSSTHPKMRIPNPPMPPGLVKKRQRWSLGLLRRRSSSHGEGTASNSAPVSSAPGSAGGTRHVRASCDSRVYQPTNVLEEEEAAAGEAHPPPHTDTPS